VYAGAFVSGRNSKRGPEPVRVENACPAIIDRETFNKVQEQLETRRLELEYLLSDTKVELADMKTVAGYVADLRNLLNESSLSERKSFVRSFVKEVKVTGDEVLLTYTIPMLPKGITEEKLPVLSIVQYGGR